jgi:hypothetical protein
MFKVWQNLAPFGGRLISGAVEALSTKLVNRRLSVLLIVIFCIHCCYVAYHNQPITVSVMR